MGTHSLYRTQRGAQITKAMGDETGGQEAEARSREELYVRVRGSFHLVLSGKTQFVLEQRSC